MQGDWRQPTERGVRRAGRGLPGLGVGLDWSEVEGAAGPSIVLWATGVDGVEAELHAWPVLDGQQR